MWCSVISTTFIMTHWPRSRLRPRQRLSMPTPSISPRLNQKRNLSLFLSRDESHQLQSKKIILILSHLKFKKRGLFISKLILRAQSCSKSNSISKKLRKSVKVLWTRSKRQEKKNSKHNMSRSIIMSSQLRTLVFMRNKFLKKVSTKIIMVSWKKCIHHFLYFQRLRRVALSFH